MHRFVSPSPASFLASRASVRFGAPVALAASLALSGEASAQQALSADPEIVNPRFGTTDIPGVPLPVGDVKNTVRVGALLQYQLNPVTGYRLDQEVGTIVGNRFVTQLGVSWDAAKWVTPRFVLPINANWGTDVPQLAADGGGLGDLSIGAGFRMYGLDKNEPFRVGAQADLYLPTGRAVAYMGERSVRAVASVQLMGSIFNYVDLAFNPGIAVRKVLDTKQDFETGPELILQQGARVNLPWIPLSLTQSLHARGGFTNFFRGGAENALEVLGGVQIRVPEAGFNTSMLIDLQAGRGTNQGYGTTDLRVLAGLTITRNPGKKPKPAPVVVIERPPPPELPPPEEIEEEPTFDEGQVAIRKKESIEIRDPIDFYVDTANIIPTSLPTLEAVASLINDDYRILHLVIEGHASAEGEHQYNYELSMLRAEAIYKQLILYGVAPERMSFRGMGETRPKVEGDTEEAWAQNRRVEFRIVSQYDETDGKPPPVYGEFTKLPWSGDQSPIKTPKSPAVLKAEEDARKAAEAEAARRRDRFDDAQRDEGFDFDGSKPKPQPAPEEPKDDFAEESFEDGEEAGSGEPAPSGDTEPAPTGGEQPAGGQ